VGTVCIILTETVTRVDQRLIRLSPSVCLCQTHQL